MGMANLAQVGPEPRVRSVRHVVGILRALASSPDPLPAAVLARHLGLPRSTAYQLLGALCDEGLVVHIPERRAYGLAVGVFELGSAYLRHQPLEHLARPLLARLVHDLDDTVHLGILHGNEVLYLLKEQPKHPTTLVTAVGVRLPAHLTACGRAILMHLPAPQVTAVFAPPGSFVNRTGTGPRSLSALRLILAEDRRRGWAVEVGAVTDGIVCIAAAVFNHTGLPTAAITVSFRHESRPVETWEAMATRVVRAADRLTIRLGGARTQPRPPATVTSQ